MERILGLIILGLSFLFQLITSYLAFSLIRITRKRTAWLLISTAIFFMAIRRLIPLWHLITRDNLLSYPYPYPYPYPHPYPYPYSYPYPFFIINELMGLILSFILMIGVSLIKPIFLYLKRSEEEIKKVMKVKSEFISFVAHELRTPLTTIKEGIGIVEEGLIRTLNDQQKSVLGTAKKNVDRLARMINDVLNFQKLESGQMSWIIQKNDLNEVVQDVYKTMLPVVKARGLDFTVTCEGNLPKTLFDKDKIIQVLINLVNNAVKFTSQGGITITTKREEEFLKVMVQDTGIGIKVEDIPRLFQSFQQVGNLSGREEKGTGLGLAICKQIITHHGGKIWAESKYGCGTELYFTLPIK